MARKHISWKTKCASALFELDFLRMVYFGAGVKGTAVTLDHAKKMAEEQYLSLWHFDHNRLHCFEGGDHFSNLTPMPIKDHRTKTKQDAKIIAKSRRIRKKLAQSANEIHEALGPEAAYRSIFGQTVIEREIAKSRLRSRGFDKTKTRGFDGKVRERRK